MTEESSYSKVLGERRFSEAQLTKSAQWQSIRVFEWDAADDGDSAGFVLSGTIYFVSGVHICNAGVAGRWYIMIDPIPGVTLASALRGWLPANGNVVLTGGILGTISAKSVVIHHDFGAGKAYGSVWGWKEDTLINVLV